MFENCKYVISAVTEAQYPNKEGKPEFAFFGRSNVGKSSLVNAITGKKLLAKVSSKPGKTICMNFFSIDERFYFIDVPGYGFASRSQEQRAKFGSYIEEYLEKSKNLKVAFLLVDTKVGPTKDDILMYNYLQYLNINICVVATKCDKIGSTLRQRAMKEIKQKLNNDNVIMTSTVERIGINEVIEVIKNNI